MKASDALDNAIWAIDEEWLLRLRAIALGEGEGPEAVAARLGRPLQNAQEATVRNGVAIIPIVGPIFRYANVFTQVSGATSVEILARDLRAALDDSAVRAILLEVNSPGGQVDGVNEAAEMIAAAEKPVAAYISGMGTSAAYWLASAADEVVVDATARLGSIGVVVAIDRDKKGRDGVIEIVSSQSPNKRPDVLTPEGRSQIQGQVDAIADVFIDAVARNRDVSRETVEAEFGQGGVKVGRAALDARMADSEGSLESTLARLAASDWTPRRRRKRMGKAAVATEDSTEATVTESQHKAEIEKIRAEAFAQGKEAGLAEGKTLGIAEGAKAERDRLLAIDRLAMAGHDKLVEEAKDSGMSPADFSMKQTEAEKATRAKHLDALKKDGQATVTPVPTATGETKSADDASKPLEERCKAVWDADPKIREEFGTFEGYVAFRKNEPRIRILRTKQAS